MWLWSVVECGGGQGGAQQGRRIHGGAATEDVTQNLFDTKLLPTCWDGVAGHVQGVLIREPLQHRRSGSRQRIRSSRPPWSNPISVSVSVSASCEGGVVQRMMMTWDDGGALLFGGQPH
jgi:hypothetical protein